eukprot:gene5781-2483_t
MVLCRSSAMVVDLLKEAATLKCSRHDYQAHSEAPSVSSDEEQVDTEKDIEVRTWTIPYNIIKDAVEEVNQKRPKTEEKFRLHKLLAESGITEPV